MNDMEGLTAGGMDIDAFLLDLAAVCRRHGVEDLSACSCCDGVNVRYDDDHLLFDVRFDAHRNVVGTSGLAVGLTAPRYELDLGET